MRTVVLSAVCAGRDWSGEEESGREARKGGAGDSAQFVQRAICAGGRVDVVEFCTTV